MCGIYCSKDLSTFEVLEQANRKRGNFATGILCMIKKDDMYDYEMIKQKGTVDWTFSELPTNDDGEIYYLGHNQAPTSVERVYRTNTSHPFLYGDWIVAHNGVLTNFKELKKEHIPSHKCNVDSSIIPALLGENDFSVGPPETIDDEVANIARTLELLEGTFALWLYNKRTNNIFIARQGSTLFYKGTNVSSIKGEGYKEVSEGIIYKYDEKGLTPMEGFVSSSPFFTL